MPCKLTKGYPPRPEVGLSVTIIPARDSVCRSSRELGSMGQAVQKRPCKVLGVGDAVKVEWLDSEGGTADVPIQWWRNDAFASVSVPQLEPRCELCGALFNAEFCRNLCTHLVMSHRCRSCAAVASLAGGHQVEAAEQMRVALAAINPKPYDLGPFDSLSRHWSSLRTVFGLLNVIQYPVPLSIAEVEEAQEVDVSSLASFASSWRRWVEKYLMSKHYRESAQLHITLEVSRAKRIHGDGIEEEIARRRAEESPAWCKRQNLAEGIEKRTRGIEYVQRLAEQGKITTERLEEIVAQRHDELKQLTAALEEHERSPTFSEALAAIENYARWFHASGIAAWQEERQRLANHLPSFNGMFLEDVVGRWLEHEVSSLPLLELGFQRKVLRNVSFRGVSMPYAVASEFDAFVVLCRLCDDSLCPPKQAGPIDGLWQVVALERWIEVKASPDEVFEALCRHRDARLALAASTGYIGHDSGPDGRFWFPAKVFADFLDGVTFVTTPGCAAVVQRGSQVPRSLLTPVPLLMRLFQFALDRLEPPFTINIDDPGANWDYVEELYNRSGEIFMHEGEVPEHFIGYLQNAREQLKELVEKGQVLVVRDPFCGCYQAPAQTTRTSAGTSAIDEIAQCISLYVLEADHAA